MNTQPNIAFIGTGNMARAILEGLINSGYPADHIHATTLFPEQIEDLAAKGVHTGTDNAAAVAASDVVVLAVKPQMMQELLQDLAPALQAKQPLVISIAAGITVEALRRWAGYEMALVRCMPNTPALVGKGASGLYACANVDTQQKAIAEKILTSVGVAIWVDSETLIDTVTAVSGSGPAYYFMMMECMTAAAIKLGLDAENAEKLVLQTALGAAEMATQSKHDAAELRRRVTSPKGTTEQAILSFQRDDLEAVVERAMQACFDRAGSLADELCGK